MSSNAIPIDLIASSDDEFQVLEQMNVGVLNVKGFLIGCEIQSLLLCSMHKAYLLEKVPATV
jgi:hypothetical protein